MRIRSFEELRNMMFLREGSIKVTDIAPFAGKWPTRIAWVFEGPGKATETYNGKPSRWAAAEFATRVHNAAVLGFTLAGYYEYDTKNLLAIGAFDLPLDGLRAIRIGTRVYTVGTGSVSPILFYHYHPNTDTRYPAWAFMEDRGSDLILSGKKYRIYVNPNRAFDIRGHEEWWKGKFKPDAKLVRSTEAFL